MNKIILSCRVQRFNTNQYTIGKYIQYIYKYYIPIQSKSTLILLEFYIFITNKTYAYVEWMCTNNSEMSIVFSFSTIFRFFIPYGRVGIYILCDEFAEAARIYQFDTKQMDLVSVQDGCEGARAYTFKTYSLLFMLWDLKQKKNTTLSLGMNEMTNTHNSRQFENVVCWRHKNRHTHAHAHVWINRQMTSQTNSAGIHSSICSREPKKDSFLWFARPTWWMYASGVKQQLISITSRLLFLHFLDRWWVMSEMEMNVCGVEKS